MNWKRAGVILVTLGVTATVGYLAYSKFYSANSKDLEMIEKSCANCHVFSGLTEDERLKMSKNVHNLSKKQLQRFYFLDSKFESMTPEEIKEHDSLLKKWGFKNK